MRVDMGRLAEPEDSCEAESNHSCYDCQLVEVVLANSIINFTHPSSLPSLQAEQQQQQHPLHPSSSDCCLLSQQQHPHPLLLPLPPLSRSPHSLPLSCSRCSKLVSTSLPLHSHLPPLPPLPPQTVHRISSHCCPTNNWQPLQPLPCHSFCLSFPPPQIQPSAPPLPLGRQPAQAPLCPSARQQQQQQQKLLSPPAAQPPLRPLPLREPPVERAVSRAGWQQAARACSLAQ